MPSQIIHLHRDAPPKPEAGDRCNGCGVCCAAELCPAGILLFRQRHGPCPALEWVSHDSRGAGSEENHGSCYRCGLISNRRAYLPKVPMRAEGGVLRLFARWIAAGTGCDSVVEVETEASEPTK